MPDAARVEDEQSLQAEQQSQPTLVDSEGCRQRSQSPKSRRKEAYDTGPAAPSEIPAPSCADVLLKHQGWRLEDVGGPGRRRFGSIATAIAVS